jgi:hypothetical protein
LCAALGYKSRIIELEDVLESNKERFYYLAQYSIFVTFLFRSVLKNSEHEALEQEVGALKATVAELEERLVKVCCLLCACRCR